MEGWRNAGGQTIGRNSFLFPKSPLESWCFPWSPWNGCWCMEHQEFGRDMLESDLALLSIQGDIYCRDGSLRALQTLLEHNAQHPPPSAMLVTASNNYSLTTLESQPCCPGWKSLVWTGGEFWNQFWELHREIGYVPHFPPWAMQLH